MSHSLVSEHRRGQRITVVLRYDDCSSRSDTTAEVKLLDALRQRSVPLTVGVIPFVTAGSTETVNPQDTVPLDPHKSDLLRESVQAGLAEVALHGCTHQTILSRAEGGWTEFARLGYHDQLARIARGKSHLQQMLGTRVSTFIPPWNSCDVNTLRALEHLGFKCISTGRRRIPARTSRLKVLPWTCSLFDLPKAVQSAREAPDHCPVIVGLLHPQDLVRWQSDRLSFQDLDGFVAWIASQKDVQVSTIDRAVHAVGGLGLSHHRNYAYFASPIRRRLAAPFMRKPLLFYPSPRVLRGMRLRDQRRLALLYCLPLLTGTWSGYFALRGLSHRRTRLWANSWRQEG